MSEPASISTGIAERYAKAMFELAQSDNQIDALESDIDALDAALAESPEFADLVKSPLYSRKTQQDAVTALASAMGLSALASNTLALMASKRRLFVLPQLVRALREMIADEKGVVTAEVAAATALSEEQTRKLAETLKAKVGKDVTIKTTVDESLIGGLVVKVGSRMIDMSVAAKLANLQHAMKEVG
ncbi:F0F1 ATP synthase subunit delta [Meridianimarinicoccus roseus]|uniref:ATP synthase subunit delta n=1 Tax=Meridianimarinicoccus roseus TaxID=2072018 RepID=A0A2V2L6G9_9RHOB|nr:F0F1 ATP synthase subunit delta [Meridianimarinicoccus roseus]PWR00910.1 F0F1 ATP synthase subunit delta [Meridianimarinicoccus roseus]